MSEKVGVVRTLAGLRSAAKQLSEWRELLEYQYEDPRDWETVNMLTMAGLIVDAAMARRSSLGVHLVAG
jgi:aspartate oxidase